MAKITDFLAYFIHSYIHSFIHSFTHSLCVDRRKVCDHTKNHERQRKTLQRAFIFVPFCLAHTHNIPQLHIYLCRCINDFAARVLRHFYTNQQRATHEANELNVRLNMHIFNFHSCLAFIFVASNEIEFTYR